MWVQQSQFLHDRNELADRNELEFHWVFTVVIIVQIQYSQYFLGGKALVLG